MRARVPSSSASVRGGHLLGRRRSSAQSRAATAIGETRRREGTRQEAWTAEWGSGEKRGEETRGFDFLSFD